jgi:hypothetical protein
VQHPACKWMPAFATTASMTRNLEIAIWADFQIG